MNAKTNDPRQVDIEDYAYGKDLEPHHCRLLRESGISPEIAKARGYRTARIKAELEGLGFGRNQRRVPGLLIPIRDVTGTIATYQLRPDEPRRRDNKPIKYETPSGSNRGKTAG